MLPSLFAAALVPGALLQPPAGASAARVAADTVPTAGAARPATAPAQPDTARPGRALETVTVTAVRGGDAAVARTTLGAAQLQQAYTGQDVPLLLQQAPAVTTFAQSGSQWNYSYFALRGVAQSRINLTLDGIPLNEPEDQQLYFSNFADLANSIRSVQIQRGVGTSSYGHASLGGSVNFETVPLTGTRRGGEVQLGGGSFGAARAAGEWASGLQSNRTAVYARFSNQRADGYRLGSQHAGNSGFLSAGWFGDRDLVKVTLLSGQVSNGQAYTPVPLDVLRQDPRANPIAGVGDRFRQNMAAVTYTRLLSADASLATTVYGFNAGGWYDYPTWVEGTPNPRWRLASRWGGVVSAAHVVRGATTFDAGVHASTYSRDHRFADRPDLESPGYDNRGYKSEGSAFAKVAQGVGPLTLYGDLQVRQAAFRYRPTVGSPVPVASVNWSFLNPKAGVVWQAARTLSFFASHGATSREPTRADMLGGADDIGAGDASALLPLTRVRPERLQSTEVGVDWQRGGLALRVNAFAMEFRDEIGLTGETTPLGYDVRRNFGRSYRRGVELEGSLALDPRLTVSATAAVSRNRVRSDVDPATGATIRDVPLVLSPSLVATQRVVWRALRRLDLTVDGRYQSRSALAPTTDRQFSAPSFFVLDGGATVRLGRHAVLVQGRNLLDRFALPAGDVSSGGVPRFFILAPRNVEVVARLGF